MRYTPALVKRILDERLPEGRIVPAHTEKGHFYKDMFASAQPMPSVTGKLQVIKDESLINYKMNRAIDYVFAHWKEFTEANVMEHLDNASKESSGILKDAGDVGTEVHDIRQQYFTEWIKTGARPQRIALLDTIFDSRIVSALRALDKFCTDYEYVPIKTEMYVAWARYQVGGTLDDLGFLTVNGKRYFTLMDLKTSNQLKDTYFFQVVLYYLMLQVLTGLRPQKLITVRLSKTNGTYDIEEIFNPDLLSKYAINLLKLVEGLEIVKGMRKDNQKNVLKL